MRKGLITLVAAAALVGTACSPSLEEPSDLPPGVDPTPTSMSAPAQAHPPEGRVTTPPGDQGPECTADDIQVTGEFGQKPEITIPENCAPPKTLLTRDLVEGTGPAAEPGDTLRMNYALVTWSNGQMLENSFDRNQPYPVVLGQGDVIAGWDEGLVGIKQSGRRLLVVPPDKGYGHQQGHELQHETLVFVVDAVQVTPAS
ncbi:peptidylprolyl isomerase [Amycolatopsis arida]|uniref:Peptidyl-prolyl cis-trans isomerase n=1 Tax=Amycolatopsis arida TaxID=587909 RepID=A0A1I5Z2A9_9PSEU|nr:FKBP-type peptidyl-prolyl cis-trans isomerase [Amycolatopsis arida]TDX90038.1 peptidylprolyl isomerase [Amycolatopsis arida]SFQ50227.1 peptidylprolyl isomerase [Amycolatopsis arida]